jgi:prepilin-type N-terminal cleavage/methylation domain-containing protein
MTTEVIDVLQQNQQSQQSQQSRGVPPRTGPARSGSVRGFTLIELMISIALVLLLILGINQVFTYTTQAVGAGEAINAAIRSSRAAQAQMTDDFSGIVPNGTGINDAASIIIASRAYYAFGDAKDQASQGQINSNQSNTAGLPPAAFLDLSGEGTVGDPTVNGDVVYPSTYNFRNHRLDVMSFFSRGLFQRQTGNQGVFVDNLASQEAWIWYGHLWLPDNNGNDMTLNYPNSTTSSTFPCMGNTNTNPNNCFGSKLILGRMATLLLPPNGGVINDRQGVQQWYLGNTTPYFLTPLTAISPVITTGNPPQSPEQGVYALCDSRVDLAGITISQFQTQLTAFINLQGANSGWWDRMMSGNQLAASARFKANPFVVKPMTSRGMGQAAPCFLSGCSQFIVEFAGDFLTQDNDITHITRTGHSEYGDVNGPGPDGKIDYVLVPPPNVVSPPLSSYIKQIAWYGLPRSTSNNQTISAANGDVVPLRDYFQLMYSATTGMLLPVPYTTIPNLTPTNGYPTFEQLGPAYQLPAVGYGTAMKQSEAQTGYVCAFGPKDAHPKLIRITLTLDDPTGRLPDGQSYQFVFALP